MVHHDMRGLFAGVLEKNPASGNPSEKDAIEAPRRLLRHQYLNGGEQKLQPLDRQRAPASGRPLHGDKSDQPAP